MFRFSGTILILLITLCGLYAGEENMLRNGDFSAISKENALPDGWGSLTNKCKMSIDKSNLPEGLKASVKIVPTQKANGQGAFSQKINLAAGGPKKLILSGYIRAEANNEAFIQVKLYNNKKELQRISSPTTKKIWQEVKLSFSVEGADRVEVLCRWKRNEHYIGKACWFTGLKMIAGGKALAVVGDSTVQNYPKNSERRGWGQMLPQRFSERLIIKNYAAGGRSSKTFREEKRWEKVVKDKPDFVLIQFGHNDSHTPGRPEATDAKTDFKANMERYVDEALKDGMIPVLVTPPARRYFKGNNATCDTLKPYAETTRQVAANKGVLCIDLFTESLKKYNELGDEKTIELFCSSRDRSHFSEKGADFLANQIIAVIQEKMPELAASLKK